MSYSRRYSRAKGRWRATWAPILLVILWSMCGEPPGPDVPIAELPHYDEVPEIEIGRVRWSEDVPEAERAELLRQVQGRLEELVGIVHSGSLVDMARLIDPDRGVFVDYKAFRDNDAFVSELRRSDGYMHDFFIESDDPDRVPLREVLHLTRSIRADIFVESQDQCEVELTLEDVPSRSYFFNNPVLVKSGDSWYFYRLF